jgi:hypothetical protein
MKNKRIRLFVIIGSSVILLVCIIARIGYVNNTAYKINEQTYPMDYWIPLDGDFFYEDKEHTEGYYFKVSSAEAISYKEFMRRFGKDENYLTDNLHNDVVLLKVDIKNTNKVKGGGIFIRDCWLFNEYMSGYFDRSDEYMKIANAKFNEKLEGVTVQPETEASMYFVYDTKGVEYESSYLDEHRNDDYLKMYLNISQYPTRKLIELDIKMNL